ncbi:FkbM family methyltransferase [Floridanema aerugineum]|uniref:FkbM family methyltransferase n=1 Tax=Floridaenema aerugineum BLCC-F46 TaxID=3153654 RepID=A0ABV4X5P3_9CYAN
MKKSWINNLLSEGKTLCFRGHHFYSKGIEPSSIVLDLGSHKGEFSSQMSETFGCKCYAVEALPYLYEQIKEDNLLIKFNYVITNVNEPVKIYISNNPEANSINSLSAENWGVRGTVVVNGITLEKFFQINSINYVDILKIDIEGAEIELFNSTQDEMLLKIKQITIEFHDFIENFDCREQVQTIKHRLHKLGFFSLSFSQIYNTNTDILFINSNLCLFSKYDWLKLYIIKYIMIPIGKIKYNIRIKLSKLKQYFFSKQKNSAENLQ